MDTGSALPDLRPPNRLDDLGVPPGLAEELFLRRVVTDRVTTISAAARDLAISPGVGEELASTLRSKNLVEYLGAEGRDYRIQLTEAGQRMIVQRMANARHVSVFPVPLDAYTKVVEAQRVAADLGRDRIRAAFADLVIDETVVDQIGPAYMTDGAIFLYGPPGTGKTSLAERFNRIVDDPVLVPRLVEIDGQLIAVFDPSLHVPLPGQPPNLDPRWVLCERPLVLVGGELDREMLDLQHDRQSGVNLPPIQMLANNGVLVVDDFGRQAIRPEEILNRWILPLSRRIDFLKSNTGAKFTVPFELKLVISTNLDPRSLGDEAFLRRLRNKIYVGATSEAAFATILEQAAARSGLSIAPGGGDYLNAATRAAIGELRPYVAIDFCELVARIADFEGSPRVLDKAAIDRATALYFVQSQASDMDLAPMSAWTLPRTAAPRRRRSDDGRPGPTVDPLAGLDDLAATLSYEGRPVHGYEFNALTTTEG